MGQPSGLGHHALRPGDAQSGFSQFQCHGGVLPGWRGRGIDTRILAESEWQARWRLREPPTRTVYLEAYADERQQEVAEL